MVCTHDPEPEPLEGVRRLGIEDIDVFMPAAIDMFTEEVGVSPIAGGRGPGYRARVAQSISQGRVYGRIDHGETIFKAAAGAAAGVWAKGELEFAASKAAISRGASNFMVGVCLWGAKPHDSTMPPRVPPQLDSTA